MSSSSFSDRVDLVKRFFAGLVIISTLMLAVIGTVYIIAADQMRRDIHNSATCDETCASMDLRNMNQPNSCWCGDDLHSDHVIPLAWKFEQGEITPTVKTVELDIGN